jgi:AAA family ATP:ADP antiporter
MGICLFVILFAVSNSFVVILQADTIAQTYTDPLKRTELFSLIDLIVSSLVLFTQLFVTSNLIKWLGYRTTLMLIPVVITVGFGALVIAPILPIMITLEILRRSGEYAIAKPTREMLFSVVKREEKYKAKNFIDTAILRTGDTASSWLYTGLKAIGAAGATIPMVSVALGLAWCSVAYWLGTQYQRLSGNEQKPAGH